MPSTAVSWIVIQFVWNQLPYVCRSFIACERMSASIAAWLVPPKTIGLWSQADDLEDLELAAVAEVVAVLRARSGTRSCWAAWPSPARRSRLCRPMSSTIQIWPAESTCMPS